MESDGENSGSAALAEWVKAHVVPAQLVGPDADNPIMAFLPAPTGTKIVSLKPILDQFREAPERRAGTAEIQDLQSFIAHVNRTAEVNSAVFADRDKLKLVAVYDYDQASCGSLSEDTTDKGKDDPGRPGFRAHRAVYAFPVTEEWKVWTAMCGRPLAQDVLANFLEDHVTEVLPPPSPEEVAVNDKLRKLVETADLLRARFATPEKLVEVSRGLTLNVGRKIAQHRALATGEVKLVFEEEHTDAKGEPVDIPGAFLIGIALFYGSTPFRLMVRLRYRIKGGTVEWTMIIHRLAELREQAFLEAIDLVAAATSLPVFIGVPEPAVVFTAP